MGNIIMSKKEVKQAEIIARFVAGEITRKKASWELKMTERGISKAAKRYRKRGLEKFGHANRGKESPRKWKDEERVIGIIRSDQRLQDAGPTYLAEKLEELHGIVVNRETLRRSLIKHGLHVAKKLKIKHRLRRERKAALGMMVQLDGSVHDWLEGRGPRCTLLVFIDDATSKILWLRFVPAEALHPILQASREYFEKYGLPLSLYTDRGSVFKVNTRNENDEKITQFERALGELGIELIHAMSPQAKGRVERANKTLQDRLIKDMRFANISTLEEANRFVQETYIPRHNAKFAVIPASQEDAHRSIKGFDLDHILTARSERIIQNDSTISFRNRLFQLFKHPQRRLRPNDKVAVLEKPNGSIALFSGPFSLQFSEVWQRPKVLTQALAQERKTSSKIYHKPPANHPWKQSFKPLSSARVG